jgi:4-alpha-glucanotransferase
LFNSRNIKYKKPFGAIAVGENVEINFPIPDNLSAIGVVMWIRCADIKFSIALKKASTKKICRIFKTKFTLPTAGIYFYRFEIETTDGIRYVGHNGNGIALIGEWLHEWQLTVFDKEYNTPEWVKGGLIYHIFVDRFSRIEDDKIPRFGYLKSWYEDLTIADWDGVYRANDFYGGNIKGIISKLDYLKELSVTAIYLSPIFQSSSNHRYDIGNYLNIDPLFGDEQEFRKLIDLSSKKGIAVILDGVFNHTGADSIYFNKFSHFPTLGAYQSPISKYFSWYNFTEYPDKYDCWWGITVVPSIKRECLDFQNFIAGDGGVIEKWTQMGVKGWRLDVVDELSSRFVKEIRRKVKSIDNDVALIGEVWEDASTKVSYDEEREYFLGKELDGVMNYPFRSAIIDYITKMDDKKFINDVMTITENYPAQALECCMSLIGTHDTTRIINILSEVHPSPDKSMRLGYRLSYREYRLGKSRVKLAAVLQYFLPGIPTIYYGDEVGMQGFDDPINRRPMTFGGDADLLDHYKKLGAIRKRFKDSFRSSLQIESLSNGAISITRGRIIAKINPTSEEISISDDVEDLLTRDNFADIPPMTAIIHMIDNPQN